MPVLRSRDQGDSPTESAYLPLGGHPLNKGLLHFFKMEEGSGDRIDLIGGYDMSPSNAPNSATGLIGDGVNFVAGSSQRLLGTGNMPSPIHTWACWFKGTGISGSPLVMGQETFGAGLRNNEIFRSGAFVYSRADSSSDFSQVQWDHSALLDDDSFHLVMGTCLGTAEGGDGLAKLYVDDVGPLISLQTGDPIDVVEAPDDNYAMGGSTTTFITMVMDNVGFWDRVLTANERALYFNGGDGWEPS